MDLQKIAIEKIKEFEKSGKIEEIIAEKLEKTFKSVIDDCLDSWGNFGKELKEILKEELNINRNDLDIKAYNQIISESIRTSLREKLESTGLNKLDLLLDDEIIGVTNGEMEFQDLIDKFKDEYEYLEEDDYIGLDVEIDDDGYSVIRLNPSDTDYNWLFTIRINKAGRIWRATKMKEKYHDSSKRTIVGSKYQFEGVIEKLYLEGVKIINIKDADYMNTCYHEDYDY